MILPLIRDVKLGALIRGVCNVKLWATCLRNECDVVRGLKCPELYLGSIDVGEIGAGFAVAMEIVAAMAVCNPDIDIAIEALFIHRYPGWNESAAA